VGCGARRQGPGEWVRASGQAGRHSVTGDDRIGKEQGATEQSRVGWFGLVEEVDDREAARVGGAEMAEPVGVGDAFPGGQVGDRLRGDPQVCSRSRSRKNAPMPVLPDPKG
jgi:hypothetical protein